MNIYLYFYTSVKCYIVTVWLIFVDVCDFNDKIVHEHIKAHTYKHTYMISTREQLHQLQPGTGAWLEYK